MLPTTSAIDPTYSTLQYKPGGFDFSNVARNEALLKMFENHTTSDHGDNTNSDAEHQRRIPQAMKTGTTICGVVFKDGVVLGADTRATGELVVDKNCAKLHYMAPNIYCAGAGTAADCVQVTAWVSARLELLKLNSDAPRSRVVTAMTMAKRYLYENGGEIETALVMGGTDETGGHIYAIYPHGSTDKLSFASMGSGSLAAMSVLESRYKDDLSEEEAIACVRDAIRGGIFNDLGSGSNVDIVVIRRTGTSYLRNYQTPNDVSVLRQQINLPPTAFNFPIGTMKIKSEIVETFPVAMEGVE
jgi:20S proteasome subunit beta 2